MNPVETRPDLAAVKNRQQAAWASGDYAVIGTTLQIVGESLAEACDLRTDEQVLDVAAGNGNATLAAARRGCRVTSTDYVPALLDRAAERARAERLVAEFQVADAEALPFEAGRFDAVVSTFGVMFTPDHAQAATEMLRVTRSGGRIGLANWTPASFVGEMFRTLGRHVPPPAGVASPLRWGVSADLRDLFGGERRVPHLVRPGRTRVRQPAAGGCRGARTRPAGPARTLEPRRPLVARDPERVPRGGRHPALRVDRPCRGGAAARGPLPRRTAPAGGLSPRAATPACAPPPRRSRWPCAGGW